MKINAYEPHWEPKWLMNIGCDWNPCWLIITSWVVLSIMLGHNPRIGNSDTPTSIKRPRRCLKTRQMGLRNLNEKCFFPWRRYIDQLCENTNNTHSPNLSRHDFMAMSWDFIMGIELDEPTLMRIYLDSMWFHILVQYINHFMGTNNN